MKKLPMIPNKVVVLGSDHHNGLGIIRSLGEIGVRVFFIAIGTSKSYVAKSKYIEQHWCVEQEQDIYNILLEKFNENEFKPIVIPSDDFTASFIDKNLNKLKQNFLVPSIGKLENAIIEKMNKLEMNKLAEKHGLLVPKSIVINLTEVESMEESINEIDIIYPCIVKPLQSIDGAKSDITISSDSRVLKENLKKLKSNYKEVIIQELISKEGELDVQGLATSESKEIIIPGVIEKIRQSTSALGSTTYARLVKSNSLVEIEKIESFIRDLEYKGIFDIDFIYSKNKIYFIEVNFRNGANGYAYTKAGTNLPVLWCLDLIGQDISKKTKVINKEVFFMNEFADIKNVFNHKIDINIIKWIFQFLAADAHLIFNARDIKPFVYKILNRLIN